MSITTAITALAIIGIGAALARMWQRRSELRSINARPPLDDNAIFLTYYVNSGLSKELVIEIWHEIADQLKLPPDKLRPQDRFGKDIGKYLITSNGLDSLNELARRRAKKRDTTIDLSRISTVDGYVRTFAAPRTE